MALSTAMKNTMLNTLDAAVTHIGLANAGTEVTGGAYARQAIAWGAAAGGVKAMTGTETFSVPGGQTVNQVILRDALAAGTNQGDAAVTEESFGGDGTYEVTALTVTLTDV